MKADAEGVYQPLKRYLSGEGEMNVIRNKLIGVSEYHNNWLFVIVFLRCAIINLLRMFNFNYYIVRFF